MHDFSKGLPSVIKRRLFDSVEDWDKNALHRTCIPGRWLLLAYVVL